MVAQVVHKVTCTCSAKNLTWSPTLNIRAASPTPLENVMLQNNKEKKLYAKCAKEAITKE